MKQETKTHSSPCEGKASHLDSSPSPVLKNSTCGTTSLTAGTGHPGFADVTPSVLHHCEAQRAELNPLLEVAVL